MRLWLSKHYGGVLLGFCIVVYTLTVIYLKVNNGAS